jgi:hypothetical protein
MCLLLSRVNKKWSFVTLCTHFATKHTKCCDVMWCVMWSDVVWCDLTWCDVIWYDVMWCDVMWCDLIWYDVMWCDTHKFWVPKTQCWAISSMDSTLLCTQLLQSTNQGTWIGSSGRTRRRGTIKGRTIHNSSWITDIGWQHWKVSLVHCYERRNKNTSIAFIFQVSVTVVEFEGVGFWNIGNLTDVMTSGAKNTWSAIHVLVISRQTALH